MIKAALSFNPLKLKLNISDIKLSIKLEALTENINNLESTRECKPPTIKLTENKLIPKNR